MNEFVIRGTQSFAAIFSFYFVNSFVSFLGGPKDFRWAKCECVPGETEGLIRDTSIYCRLNRCMKNNVYICDCVHKSKCTIQQLFNFSFECMPTIQSNPAPSPPPHTHVECQDIHCIHAIQFEQQFQQPNIMIIMIMKDVSVVVCWIGNHI